MPPRSDRLHRLHPNSRSTCVVWRSSYKQRPILWLRVLAAEPNVRGEDGRQLGSSGLGTVFELKTCITDVDWRARPQTAWIITGGLGGVGADEFPAVLRCPLRCVRGHHRNDRVGAVAGHGERLSTGYRRAPRIPHGAGRSVPWRDYLLAIQGLGPLR